MTQQAAVPRLLVFTDLDGSLMEHESYSIEPALESLESLRRRGFTLVMNSSKTAAEIGAIQERLSLQAPFIAENGALLQLLEADAEGHQRIQFGRHRRDWLPELHSIREREQFEFEGFADWTPREICERTGLSVAEAELAAQREFSEPILWRGASNRRARFLEILQEMGLQLLEGGRFLSIQGSHSKADAMRWLQQRLRSSDQEPEGSVISVALGDSPNDVAMLNAADVAVVIKSGKSDRIAPDGPARVIHTKRPGPAGWHDAMCEILELLDTQRLKPASRSQGD